MKNTMLSGVLAAFISLLACLFIMGCDEDVDFKETRMLEMKIGQSHKFITPDGVRTGFYVSFSGTLSDGTLVFTQDTSVESTVPTNIFFHRDVKKVLVGHCYFYVRDVKVDRITLEFASYEDGSMPKKEETKTEVEAEDVPEPVKEKQTL
jgi:hypothetical protein